MRMKKKVLLVFLPVLLLGCGKSNPQVATDSAGVQEVQLPLVTDERTDLVLSWFVDGGAEIGAAVSEVPEVARKEVRVQDPGIPPEKTLPDTIFLADLTAPKVGGHYVVKAVPRAAFEAERRAAAEKAEKEKQAALAARTPSMGPANMPNAFIPPSGVSVIMYATKHCPVCVKARRWLLEQKIPYVEKDLDSDQVAAAELQQKSTAQGIPVRGVPVFDVRGRLIPGFDPGQIIALINGGAQPVQSI